MRDTESELIRGLRRGDPQAYHQLVEDYADRLYGLAFSLLGNAHDAEDAVQETLSGVVRGIGSFQQRSALWTWLSNILVRQTARVRRSTPPIRLMELDESEAPTAKTDVKLDLNGCIQMLAAEHREVIVLRELERMSYDEISQALKIPLGTVQSRLSRARDELRRLLVDYKM